VAVSDLLVVVGPTASGKTELAAALAERLGEVVSADAFAVYRGLDIGTAKPDRPQGREYLTTSLTWPTTGALLGRDVRPRREPQSEIRSRRRFPSWGGTHFYVRALLYGLFPEPPRPVRQLLEAEWAADPAAVRARLAALDPDAAGRIASADRQRSSEPSRCASFPAGP
jgi:tRNA dimethylallyltransferase